MIISEKATVKEWTGGEKINGLETIKLIEIKIGAKDSIVTIDTAIRVATLIDSIVRDIDVTRKTTTEPVKQKTK